MYRMYFINATSGDVIFSSEYDRYYNMPRTGEEVEVFLTKSEKYIVDRIAHCFNAYDGKRSATYIYMKKVD